MHISRLKKSSAALGLIAVAALATPAAAAPPYNVGVGPFSSGDHPFTAVSKGGVSFVTSGPLGLVNMSCAGATAAGTFTAGADADGLDIGRYPNSSWTQSCVGPGGMQFNLPHFPGSVWRFNATGVATNALTDNVAVYINGIDVRVTSKPPGLCSYRITGRMNAMFKETPKPGTTVQQLSVSESSLSGNMVISAAIGCLGLIANGNTMSYVGDYDITSPNGYINIKP